MCSEEESWTTYNTGWDGPSDPDLLRIGAEELGVDVEDVRAEWADDAHTALTVVVARYYRFQPRGLLLVGHSSEDWAGNVMPGRVCAYSDPDLLLSGEGDDWFGHEVAGSEIVEFSGSSPEWLSVSNAGVSVTPVRELRRTPASEWLARRGWEESGSN
jgi:hypothetical protein